MREKISDKLKITILCALFLILFFAVSFWLGGGNQAEKKNALKIGFLYVGDESTPYTYNFIKSQHAVEKAFGDQVEILVRENVPEGEERPFLEDLVRSGCQLIFATSYNYQETVKEFAGKYSYIQFCQATASNANEKPIYDNYHTFMGHIYEGRYATGVVAGMKLQQMIDDGVITESQATIGYVGAFPYAEVISGYTAFLLGVRSAAPSATMEVEYTYSWNDYGKEKEVANRLIKDGCVIISQHSDTVGPAVACENAKQNYKVYHVGYNRSMTDVAPTTSLVSSRINWTPYFLGAVQAVLEGKKIEKTVNAEIYGNDAGAGFDKDWVQMLDLNKGVCAPGTEQELERLLQEFQKGKADVFRGDYIGVNPFDPQDTIDLRNGYQENANASAPSFGYVLQDVITVLN